MERINRSRIWGLALAFFIYIVDQAVKFALIGPLALESRVRLKLLPFFDLRWTENRGVSLGMLTADSDSQRWLLVALTSLIALAVLIWMWKERRRGDIWALALVLGGALGNITDRIRYGYVVDYADLHFGTFRPFLIFNIADAAITIGVLILLARALLMREKKERAELEET